MMHNPRCPVCHNRLKWLPTLGQVLGPGRRGTALWGAVCPECGADLKVPNGHVLLIAAAGIFFGGQTSVLLTLGNLAPWQGLLVKLMLILGFYAIAIWFFFTLEKVT